MEQYEDRAPQVGVMFRNFFKARMENHLLRTQLRMAKKHRAELLEAIRQQQVTDPEWKLRIAVIHAATVADEVDRYIACEDGPDKL